MRRVPAEGYDDEALCAAGHRGPECVEDQQQCLALPVQAPGASPDPLLRRWEKFERNPVVRTPPPGGDRSQFRDPATAWRERSGPRGEGSWVTVVGGMVEGRGTAILYVSATPVPWAGCRSWPPWPGPTAPPSKPCGNTAHTAETLNGRLGLTVAAASDSRPLLRTAAGRGNVQLELCRAALAGA